MNILERFENKAASPLEAHSMRLLVMDAETFFSDSYTLRKETTESYVRSEQFELLIFGVYEPATGAKFWLPKNEFIAWAATVDWTQTAVLGHHCHFDGLILSHHFNIKPRFWYDSLSCARLLVGNHLSVSLESLARHFNLEPKSVPYEKFRGKRWAELDHATRELLGAGCLHDIELTWTIFCELAKTFPAEEYQVVDMTIRMFTEPQLTGDIDAFAGVWKREAHRKQQLLRELRLEKSDLQSSERFAELLREHGVDPETKSGKSGPIYAFAKTDGFMADLLEHEDEHVRTLAEARLGQKSTLDQTRAERLGWMARRGMKE